MSAAATRPVWRCVRLLAGRPALVLAAGIVVAILGEASSIALVGLSGWFIASCYLSGLSATSTFSYLTPSGGVRALALARVGARYSQRLVSHSATLRWLTRLRVQMFDDAAAAPAALRRLRQGEALDRTIADADTLSETLIRSVQPVAVAIITVAGAGAAIAAYSPACAATFALGACGTAAAATEFRAGRRRRSAAHERGRARAELVAAVDAWPELMSLGAAAQLRDATGRQVARLEEAATSQRQRQSRTQTRVDLAIGATLVALCAVLLSSQVRPGVAGITMILLLSAGALDLLTGLPNCVHAAATGREAARRLAVLAPPQPDNRTPQRRPTPTAGLPLHVDHLRLAIPDSHAPPLSLEVAAGQMMIVSGRSGSGKTTLLRTISGDLDPAEGTIRIGAATPHELTPKQLIFVEHDDYIFTGTIADNLRLADPDLAQEPMQSMMSMLRLDSDGLTPSTPVGEAGRALSGGEQRRLVLARAAAADPAVLLLDEPTEGLDASTARLVMSNLRVLLPHATLIVAMHDRHVRFLPEGFGARLCLADPELHPMAGAPLPAIPGRAVTTSVVAAV
jgi:ATP-binding cassette subfamily C protein CydC